MDLFIPERTRIAPACPDEILSAHGASAVSIEDANFGPEAYLIVAGRSGIREVVASSCSVPVLVVDGPPGIPTIERDRLDTAIGTLRRAAHTCRSVPVMDLDTPKTTVPVAFDAKLMTEAPASISEFAITCANEPVAQYRADGAVLATPMGSSGYARAGGGPVCAPTLSGIVVVPIAPYRTNPRHWVLDGEVCVTIARDEERVSVIVDDDVIATLEADDTIAARLDGQFTCVDVSEGRSAFDGT